MKLEFSRQIFEKSSNIKFHENPSSGSRINGRTDRNLIVAFRNFTNSPKNSKTGIITLMTHVPNFLLTGGGGREESAKALIWRKNTAGR